MRSARATRGLELALFVALLAPLLAQWFETTKASSRLSYALLVPGLALVLAWRAARSGHADPLASARAGGGWGSLWAGLAGLLLLAGSLSGVFTLALLAVPLAACAYTARWAPGSARRQRSALALLFLMVPPPMPLLDRLNPLLVEASGETAVRLLAPLDPDASWAGCTLLFRGWTLIVAEACSGSGTFLALVTLCAFLAGLFHLRARSALALGLCALPLSLLVNGARIASSAWVIDRFGAEAGQGLAHELLGEAVVLAGVALLVLLVERSCAARARAGCT